MNQTTSPLDDVISSLPKVKQSHGPGTSLYRILQNAAQHELKKMFELDLNERRSLGPIGAFYFPYFKMGAVDSIDLFGLDELILFSFYWVNRKRYKKALD